MKIVDLGAEDAIVNLGYSSVFQPLMIQESDRYNLAVVETFPGSSNSNCQKHVSQTAMCNLKAASVVLCDLI